jgi:hypothetical protein
LFPDLYVGSSDSIRFLASCFRGWPKKNAVPGEFVQTAIVYRGKKVTVYRNGELFTKYMMHANPY